MTQAGLALSGGDLFIAAHLIDQIDEAGYLTADLLEVSQRLGVPLAQVEEVLAAIQRSTRPGSARATWPNASRCRRRRPTATIRAWRG